MDLQKVIKKLEDLEKEINLIQQIIQNNNQQFNQQLIVIKDLLKTRPTVNPISPITHLEPVLKRENNHKKDLFDFAEPDF
jgi:hypothetical protein